MNVVVSDNQHHAASAGTPILDGDALEVGWATADGDTGRLEIAGDVGDSPRWKAFHTGIPNIRSAIRSIQISRDNNRTTHQLVLNLDRMKLGPEDLQTGFRFNLAVHDNDGEGPKSWISPVPGLGRGPALRSDGFHDPAAP